MRELDEIRSLLDQGLSTEAKDRLALLISNARHDPTILALARCALSKRLSNRGIIAIRSPLWRCMKTPIRAQARRSDGELSSCADRSCIQLQWRPSQSDRDASISVAGPLRDWRNQFRPHLRSFIAHVSNYQ
jgi:hypothetical protein